MESQILTPYQGNISPKSKFSPNLKLILFISIPLIVIIVVITILIVNSRQELSDQGSTNETFIYAKTESFSDIQNIYNNLLDNMTYTDMKNIIDSSRTDLKIYSQNYIAHSATTKESCSEYISFDLYREDQINYIQNIIYHDCINGTKSTISETDDNHFLHFTGSLSNEYDSKTEAILDHLSLAK